jgi:hypothetical protein
LSGANNKKSRMMLETETGNARKTWWLQAKAVEPLVEQIRPLLAGRPPQLAGAVLGELVAIFIGQFAPALRAEQRQMLIELVDDLVPVMVEEMIEQGVLPGMARSQTAMRNAECKE